MPQAAIPPDFDADAYMTWHPSLLKDGVNTTAAARAHYARYGRAAGLVYKPLRIVYMFQAAQGPTSLPSRQDCMIGSCCVSTCCDPVLPNVDAGNGSVMADTSGMVGCVLLW